jgi:predicted nucleic acid-binding protein
MGSIAIPSGGQVYLDTDCLIYSIETQPLYWPVLKPVWEAAVRKEIALVTSELALMEVLVGPMRHNDLRLIAAYEDLFQSSDLRSAAIDAGILRSAARLRAEVVGLRSPDAIHAATAMAQNCNLFLTNDRGFKRLSRLQVSILDDVLIAR